VFIFDKYINKYRVSIESMCEKLIKIKQNECGELHYCPAHQLYHLMFNNFHLMLGEEQYESLKTDVSEIDIKFWLDKFSDNLVKRKIPIPTHQENLILVFDIHEFIQLKSLFFNHQNHDDLLYLSTNQIEYQNIFN
jgi:hypothetical protein